MKIDVTAPILDLDEQAIKDTTLRRICTDALLSALPGDDKLSGDKKAEQFALAMRIHQEDGPDLKSEDISLLKARIGRGFTPLVVGRAFQMLDPSA